MFIVRAVERCRNRGAATPQVHASHDAIKRPVENAPRNDKLRRPLICDFNSILSFARHGGKVRYEERLATSRLRGAREKAATIDFFAGLNLSYEKLRRLSGNRRFLTRGRLVP